MGTGPEFRLLVRNLRLMSDAKKAGKCHACGQKLPPKKRTSNVPTFKDGTPDVGLTGLARLLQREADGHKSGHSGDTAQ